MHLTIPARLVVTSECAASLPSPPSIWPRLPLLAAAAKPRVHVRVWFLAGGPRPADSEAGVHQPQEAVSAGHGRRGPGRVSDTPPSAGLDSQHLPLAWPHPWGWRVARGVRRAEKQGGDGHTDRRVPSDPEWPTERKGAGRSDPHSRESASPAAGPWGHTCPLCFHTETVLRSGLCTSPAASLEVTTQDPSAAGKG